MFDKERFIKNVIYYSKKNLFKAIYCTFKMKTFPSPLKSLQTCHGQRAIKITKSYKFDGCKNHN